MRVPRPIRLAMAMAAPAALLLVPVACLINYVKHPERVRPGEVFEVEVKATDDDSHELTPTLCAGLPTGWKVLSGAYEGEGAAGAIAGNLSESTIEAARVKTMHPEPDEWSCWVGVKNKHPAFKPGFGRLQVQVPDPAKGADYTLHWRVGSLENPEEAMTTTTITVPYKIYIEDTQLPIAYQTVYLSHPLKTQLAKGKIRWEHVGGTMPDGLEVEDGEIRGVPTKAGNFPYFVIRATDEGTGEWDDLDLKMIVSAAPEILTGSIPPGKETVAYSARFESSGGSFGHTWKLIGTLPPGITFDQGELKGTPTQPGRWSLTMRVTDDRTAYAERTYELVVDAAPRVDTSHGQDEAYESVPYEHAFQVPGEKNHVTWRLSQGTPPPGMAFSGAKLFGTPSEPGTYQMTVHAEDPQGGVNEQAFTLVVHAAPELSTVILPPARVTASYQAKLEGRGGTGDLKFRVDGLPEGLKLDGDLLLGTPVKAEVRSLEIEVSDSRGAKSRRRVKLTVDAAPSLPPTPPVVAFQRVALDHRFAGEGLVGEPTWIPAKETPLPPGVQFDAGRLFGVPEQPGEWPLDVEVRDATGAHTRGHFTIVVQPAPQPSVQALPEVPVGRSFEHRLLHVGGVGSVRWAVTGKLPLGLRLDQDRLAGTPRQAGTFTFVVRVTDEKGAWGEAELTLKVTPEASEDGGFSFPVEQGG